MFDPPKKHLFLLVVCIFAYTLNISAQSLSRSVVCATGTTVVTGSFSISYTLGEAVGELFSNNAQQTFLTAGFAQPDLSVQEILTSNNYSNTNFTIFPNPAIGNTKVKLGFKNLPVGRYNLAIVDALGRIIQTEEFYYSPLVFAYREYNVSGFAQGVYFVKVLGEKNFKTTISFLKQ